LGGGAAVYKESGNHRGRVEMSRAADMIQVVTQQRGELLPGGGTGIWDTLIPFSLLCSPSWQ